MAKALRTVGMVVAAVALVATGVGVAAGGAAAAATAGTAGATAGAATAATALSIAQYAGLAAGALSVVSAVAFKPKFGGSGSPTKFTTNPQSAIPYAIGRTRQSGVRIYAETWDAFKQKGEQDILGFGVLLSGGGRIDAIEKFTADNIQIDFNSTTGLATTSGYEDWMAQKIWLGGQQSTGLSMNFGGKPFLGWSTSHKLSGITHAIWAMRFDTDGKHYGAGPPEPAWIGRWVRVYDPRLDSTYPGGSGACRALQEETYVWSRNPALHALTWALGRWQNGKKTFGIGAPIENIRVGDFVEAANIADTNKWYCGGIEYSTDSKWEVFKRMLQAGGSEPTMTGAMIGCRTYAPKVSVTVINGEELLDGLTFAATKPQRDRINTIVPRYRSEEHEWEVISGAPISVAEYVAADGRVRQKEYDLPLVQHEVGQTNVDGHRQAGQLSAYEIVNAREAGPIQFTTGPKHIGLKAGDCVTLNIPSEGFNNTKVLIVDPPKFDPSNGTITFLGQTETDAKHAFALGKTSVPPPPFSLTPPEIIPAAPSATDWSLLAETNAEGIPVLVITGGSPDGAYWNSVIIQYKRSVDPTWSQVGVYKDDTLVRAEVLVDGNTSYDVRIAYAGQTTVGEWLQLPAVTTSLSEISRNNATITLYQRTNSSVAPTVSGVGNSTYTFSTGNITGAPAGWVSIIPDFSAGEYLWIIKVNANSATDTYTFANTGWSTPAIFTRSGVDGADGVNGSPAVSGYLTKEVVTLPAYANGNIVGYAGAGGRFKVYSGSTDVSSSFTLSTFANPQALGITYTNQNYAVTSGFDAAEDNASITIRATGSGAYTGVTIDKVFSLGKTKGGYEIVPTLPSTNLFEGRVVLLTTDDKLYRYTGSGWTASVPASDITGQLQNAQLADGIISASKFAASIEPVTVVSSVPSTKSTNTVFNTTDGKLLRWNGTAYIASVPAADISGQITDAQIAALSATKLTDQITTTQITDGAISTVKLAAGSVVASKIAAGTITASKLAITGENLWPDSQCQDIDWWKGPGQGSYPNNGYVNPTNANNVAAGGWYLTSSDFSTSGLVGGSRGVWTLDASVYTSSAITQVVPPTIMAKNSTTYELMVGCYNASNKDCIFVVQFYDSTGTSISVVIPIVFAAGDTTTVSKRAQFTTPTNCVSLRMYWEVPSGAALSGGKLHVGNINIREAATGTMLVDGSIVASKIAANAITSDKIEADAITAGKIAAGAVSADQLAANAVTAAKIAAGSITASKLVLENRDNVLADPGFNDLAVWDLADVEGLSAQTAFDPNMPKRSIKAFGAVGTIDRRSQYVPVEQGAAYRVRLRLYFSPDATGWIAPTIHIPMQAWFTPAPSTYRADVDNGTYPVIDLANTTIPKNQWVSYDAMFVKSSVGLPEIQARTRYNLYTGSFEMAWEVVRAGSADLIVDGAISTNKIAANAVVADKISAGAVTAAKLSVTQLSAITATIGVLRTASTGARMEVRDNVLKVYDSSNVLRVQLGDLSL